MAATLTPAAEPIPGYRLIERLGRGGFGEVWKCEAPGGFLKAIKLVYGSLDESSGDSAKAAEQEKKALERIKQIRHPFLLSLERYDIIDGQLMIVMELADRSLWDRFRECRTQGLPGIPREELLRFMAEAAEALDMMNQEYNLQHLDVKPQNLFLVHNHVKVADFGLVKVFEGMSASVTGGVTPVYAAPETFDDRVTRYSDQYSLAVVYQELLTGIRPFNGANTRQLILQHLTHPPDLTPLPECDRPAVGRALAKKPEDRFGSCSAFIAALRAPVVPPTADPQAGTVGPATTRGSAPGLGVAPPPLTRVPRPSQLISRPVTDPTVTQSLGPSVVTMQRPAYAPVSAAVTQMPVIPPEVTGLGALMPAVVVGLGAVGERVVRYLRRAISEQYGGPEAVPQLRLLSVDTDPDTAHGSPRDVMVARLYRPSHYLAKARDGATLDWLPAGLLYRLPRNPNTSGLRALGRLAFWDHARAIEARLRVELEAALEPDAIAEANRRTGLGLRTNRPRVYVVATPAGGTGGGMFLDMAFLARHVLRKLGYTKPDVVGVVLLPPADPGKSRPPALANTYATLMELAHFSRPDTAYEAKFARDVTVHDPDRPLGRCLCLPMPSGADGPARRQAAAAAAGLVLRDVLAPLGRAAEAARPPATAAAFCHTAATFRLAWPGRRLVRRAARHLAAHLLRQWTGKDIGALRPTVTAWLDEQWEARQLRPEMLIDRLTAAAEATIGQAPDAKFDALVAPLVERGALGSAIDARSACLVLNDLAELVGKPAYVGEEPPPGQLQTAMEAAAAGLATEYDQKLAELAVHFIELPRHRLAAAEEAVRQITDRLKQVVETYEALYRALAKEAAELFARLFPLIGTLDAAGGKRSAATAEVIELLRAFPKKRYQALVAGQVLSTYRGMVNAAPEYLREVNFCRQRLAGAASVLEQAGTDSGGPSPFGPGRDLFAGGRKGVDEAAADLVAHLSAEDLLEVDNRVQRQVRRQFRAVITYCLESTGSPAPLADLMCEQAEAYLTERIGVASATEAVFAHFASDPQAAHRAAAEAYDESAPTLVESAGRAVGLLAAPSGPAGEGFRRVVAEAVPGVQLLPADSPDELVFYRERSGLAVTDLPPFGPAGKAAYDAHRDTEHVPHARADVTWKPPLEK